MVRFRIGRRKAQAQAVPAFVAVPPRGGNLIAEVHEGRIATLAAALIDGATLEVGSIRALRCRGGRFVVVTTNGCLFVSDAVVAVKRMLNEDAHLRAA